MDEKMKKCCPNCCQLYQLKSVNSKSNIPLFLACDHSMCENCVRNLVKFREPIECKVCLQSMELGTSDIDLLLQNKISYYKLFPVNVYMVGELAMQNMEENNSNDEKPGNDYYVDVKAIINKAEVIQGECMECRGPTTKMCSQCAQTLCQKCFNKSHVNFAFFKSHVLQNIEVPQAAHTCDVHKGKLVGYYCNDCSKAICMDCLMLGDKYCKNHDVTSIQEANKKFASDICELAPKLDEILRRLTKTSVDIGNLLTNLDAEETTSQYMNMLNNIEQAHFSKIIAIIQKQRDGITSKLYELKNQEKESLLKAKAMIGESIKKAKSTLNNINTLDLKKSEELNLVSLYENATQIINTPWYLHRDHTENTLTVIVKDDVYPLLLDYIKLEGSADAQYHLYSYQELVERKEEIPEAPRSIVYPPELTKGPEHNVKGTELLPDSDCEDAIRKSFDFSNLYVRQKSTTQNKPKPVQVKTKPQQPFIKDIPQYHSNKSSNSTSDTTAAQQASSSYERRPVVGPVAPFTDPLRPKQLQEGTEEVVYVSHIVDPHNLYVQRACQQDKVQELLREFRTASSLPKPSVNHVAIGKTYLVRVEADNTWHRCRVVGIDKQNPEAPKIQVFCVDFGSSETVSINKLRLLSPARMQAPPPLAMHCRLANCEPARGTWTDEDATLLQSIIDNKRAVIHIWHIRSIADDLVSLECDISMLEDGVSLAHALAFQGCARLTNRNIRPKAMPLIEKPKIYLTNDYKQNSIEEVFITHIENPDNFYVRMSHHQDLYEKLSQDLKREYSLRDTRGSVYLPEIGAPYVVHVEGCDVGAAWARGVVQELSGRRHVRVLLCDSGSQLQTRSNLLRRIHTKFTTLRGLATRCHLAGVTPYSKRWSQESVALLQKFKDRPLELHVEDCRTRESLGVLLYDKSDEDSVLCINELMVKYRFAKATGLYVFNKKFDLDDVDDNKETSECSKPEKESNKISDVTILKKNKLMPPKNDNNTEAKDRGPLRLEAKVLNYQSPGLIYLSLVHQQKVFKELFDNMQKYYAANNSNGKEEWQVADRCCTICAQSQTWRRAAVLSREGDAATVFYCDFACVERVPLAALRELPPQFASVGDAAILCHLCGVAPAGGDEWPAVTKEYLKELLDQYNRIFFTKVGNFKGKSMPVELWVYHTVQGGALEPNVSEWRCLNKMIIEQGLALPDKSEQPQAIDTNSATGGDQLSFLNITGSVRDWLQIEPMKPFVVQEETENNNSQSPTTDVDVEKKEEPPCSSANTIFISDWSPPQPFACEEFTATPTSIDDDGVIYLHDVSQNDTLELIRSSLDVRFKGPDPKAKYVKWNVGEPCVAQFYLDKSFYRGRVLDVNYETSTCLIHYVDYGNDDECAFENLRKSLALYSIPVQAHKCILNRIRPVGGKKWDRSTLDYVHKTIVDKQTYVKVCGEPIGGVVPIDLKYDQLWINDHLVDLELAEYTDGTKTVVRKFMPVGQEIVKTEEEIIETDSGPDYITEVDDCQDESSESQVSVQVKHLDLGGKDWCTVMDEDENRSSIGRYVTVAPLTDTEFLCNITVMYEINKFELSVVHDHETAEMYRTLSARLQSDSRRKAALNGVYENKACLALFPEDGRWYRAVVLQYSETRKLVKVKYVDYGKVEVLPLDNLREIDEEYLELPPATLAASLHGFKVNPELDERVVAEKFTETFLNKDPFHVKVIKQDVVPSVELRDIDGKLVYETLVAQNVLVKCV